MEPKFDAITLGAAPAGLQAALALGRARRRVLVCDSGEPRNAVTRVRARNLFRLPHRSDKRASAPTSCPRPLRTTSERGAPPGADDRNR
jgi:2-polyprenyl-6-methoxyphenol hydroxylase-like FAD-dependent oxidoreductase